MYLAPRYAMKSQVDCFESHLRFREQPRRIRFIISLVIMGMFTCVPQQILGWFRIVYSKRILVLW